MSELRIGVIGPSFPPVNNIVEQAKRSEEVGYDSIWFADHLMAFHPQSIWDPKIAPIASYQISPHIFFDTMISMALASHVTEKLLIGCCVTDVLRRHPATLAQSIVTIDHISRGRTILGLGAGEGMNIKPYGIDFSRPVSKLEEAIRIMKLLWESKPRETINYDGEFWKLRDATFDLPLYDDEPVPIWIGAHGPRMLELTGKYGDGWIPVFNADIDPKGYSDKLKKIKKVMKEEGRDPQKFTAAMFAGIIIDETSENCIEIMKSPMIKARHLATSLKVFKKHGVSHPLGEIKGFVDFIPSRISKEEVMKAIEAVPLEVVRDSVLYGSPDNIADRLDACIDRGLEHVVFWNETYFGDVSKVESSFKYLREVLDYYRG